MKTTNNLFLIGFMGAGKSSVSAALGQKLGREVVEMDQCISENEGMTIPENLRPERRTLLPYL